MTAAATTTMGIHTKLLCECGSNICIAILHWIFLHLKGGRPKLDTSDHCTTTLMEFSYAQMPPPLRCDVLAKGRAQGATSKSVLLAVSFARVEARVSQHRGGGFGLGMCIAFVATIIRYWNSLSWAYELSSRPLVKCIKQNAELGKIYCEEETTHKADKKNIEVKEENEIKFDLSKENLLHEHI